jgi:hypothetical protein
MPRLPTPRHPAALRPAVTAPCPLDPLFFLFTCLTDHWSAMRNLLERKLVTDRISIGVNSEYWVHWQCQPWYTTLNKNIWLLMLTSHIFSGFNKMHKAKTIGIICSKKDWNCWTRITHEVVYIILLKINGSRGWKFSVHCQDSTVRAGIHSVIPGLKLN